MGQPSIQTLADAIERLYDLNVGVVGHGHDRHERPHKPVLLLAVLDLIALGRCAPSRIEWTQALRTRFREYLEIVRAANDQDTPENPFRRLASDGFWSPVEIVGGTPLPLRREPLVGEAGTGRVLASLTDGMERFVIRPEDRLALRNALVSRYFPSRRTELAALWTEPTITRVEPEAEVRVAEDESEEPAYGRSAAFRRKILEIYDYQCAACGLRIKMPELGDLTFVDAAHLIPFNVDFNDHPTNGLALCKNHHWAMDRFLIAPCPDGVWRVSSRLIPHRSLGEKELSTLDRRPVLPPSEPAFGPDPAALEWRCSRLQH